MTHVTKDGSKTAWPELGKFWTVPNVVTLSRIAFVVPAALIILNDGSRLLLIGFVMAAIATDWFDGRIARWSKSVSDWGKVLDPLVDKIGGSLVIIALVVKDELPMWFIGLIVLRDIFIVSGSARIARRTGTITISIWAGKVAVAAVAITVLAAIFQADPPIMRFCLILSSTLLVYSLARYLWRYFKIIQIVDPQIPVVATETQEPEIVDEVSIH